MEQNNETTLSVNKFENNSDEMILFLHGYGANKDDLTSIYHLYSSSRFNKEFDWFFWQAPFTCDGMYNSFRWFDISEQLFMQLQSPASLGEINNQSQEFLESFDKLKNIITQKSQDYKKIHLAGFSQGAMMVLNLFLYFTQNEKDINNLNNYIKIDSLSLFSGMKMNCSGIVNLAKNACRIFQSHGMQDPVIPYDFSFPLQKLFVNFDNYHFYKFVGGHQIPNDIIYNWFSFIDNGKLDTE